jgi:hypothetical protein
MISPEDDFITRPMGFGLNENEANTRFLEKKVIMRPIPPLEKTTHEICHAVHVTSTEGREKMLTKALVLTDGVSGIDWKHYKHPLPEHVYDVYMKYWGGVSFRT